MELGNVCKEPFPRTQLAWHNQDSIPGSPDPEAEFLLLDKDANCYFYQHVHYLSCCFLLHSTLIEKGKLQTNE